MKFTVGCCVYRPDHDFLREAFASIKSQVRQVDEILVVIDDASIQSFLFTQDLCDEFDFSSLNFRIIFNKQNLGLSRSRNLVLRDAVGDYVLFLDQDDKLHNDCIDNADQYLRCHDKCALLFSCCNLINANSEYIGKYMEHLQSNVCCGLKELINLCFLPLPTVLINVEMSRRVEVWFSERWKVVEDYAFWFDMVEQYGEKCLHYYEGPVASYRLHDSNTSHDRIGYEREHAALYARLLLNSNYQTHWQQIMSKVNFHHTRFMTLQENGSDFG